MPPTLTFCRGLAALLLLAAVRLAAALPALELDLSLDPSSRELKARALLTAESGDFRFTLHESLRIVEVRAGGRRIEARRRGRDDALVRWEIRLPPGANRLRIDYRGVLPALDKGLDQRGVLRALPPMASPDGSFLPAGSGWYPRPPALFSYRLRLSLPGDQRALVAGRLVAESSNDWTSDPITGSTTAAKVDAPAGATTASRYRAAFEFARPADGIDLVAGPWIVRERMVSRPASLPLRLRTYFPAELDAEPGLADAYLDDSARYIERFSKAIGAYPYSEFSVVASPLPTGFGMPTLTYIGAAVLRLPFIRKTSLAHEILHNWWGNGVYVDYAHGNWCEGLTTLMADYAAKESESEAAAGEMRLSWLRDAAALPADAQPALRDFRSRSHGADAAVGYGKAAMVLLMLRERIGEAAFGQAIRAFWSQQQFRAASWQDLRRTFEHASGENLDAFFAAWLDRRELPQVAVEAASSRPLGQAQRLTVTLTQSGRPMPLRVPLEISAPDHRQTRWVAIGSARERVQLDLDFSPQQLRLDPQTRVWRRLDALPPILRRWIGAPAPLLVNATRGGEARAAVELLARRLFETAPATIGADASANTLANTLTNARHSGATVLLAGTRAEVAAALAAAGLPPARPDADGQHGSAEVWTTSGESPLLVIAADDADALRAMQRALPHYGGQSWLVFDGAQVVARGVWPVRERVVAVDQAGPNIE